METGSGVVDEANANASVSTETIVQAVQEAVEERKKAAGEEEVVPVASLPASESYEDLEIIEAVANALGGTGPFDLNASSGLEEAQVPVPPTPTRIFALVHAKVKEAAILNATNRLSSSDAGVVSTPSRAPAPLTPSTVRAISNPSNLATSPTTASKTVIVIPGNSAQPPLHSPPRRPTEAVAHHLSTTTGPSLLIPMGTFERDTSEHSSSNYSTTFSATTTSSSSSSESISATAPALTEIVALRNMEAEAVEFVDWEENPVKTQKSSWLPSFTTIVVAGTILAAGMYAVATPSQRLKAEGVIKTAIASTTAYIAGVTASLKSNAPAAVPKKK
jgi:hypothetical protein